MKQGILLIQLTRLVCLGESLCSTPQTTNVDKNRERTLQMMKNIDETDLLTVLRKILGIPNAVLAFWVDCAI